MAELSKTIEVIFFGVDKTSEALSSIGSNTTKFANNLSSATAPLASLAQKIELAEAAVVALGVAFGANALNSFSKFQDASIDLAKVLDEKVDPPIKEFEQTAKDLSLTYGVAASDILQGTSNFVQAGFKASEATLLQKNALDLVIAGGVDAAKASDILTKSLLGFNLSAADSTQLVESLNAVSNKYATDVNQLAEGMSRISPVASTMGFTFQETTGLLTPIIEVFGSGSEAADALKTGLVKLIDDAKPVKQALESIGVAQTDANGSLRSGKDIFYDVAAAFENMDDKQKLFITSQLVGLDQAPKMVKVFDQLAKVQDITATAMENNGTVAQEVEKRLNSLSVATKINEQSWNLLSIAVGESLAQGATDSTKSMSLLGQALTKAVESGQFKPIIDGINAAETGFAKFIEQIAKNLPEALGKVDFTGLVKAFGNLGGQFGDIFSGLDVSTPQGLANAIQLFVDSLASLTTVSAGVVNGLTPLGQGLLAALKAFNAAPDSAKEFTGTVIGVGQTVNLLSGFVGSFGTAIDGIGGSLKLISGLKIANELLDIANKFGGLSGVLGNVVGLFARAGAGGAVAVTALAGVGVAAVKGAELWGEYKASQDTIEESTKNLADKQGIIAIKLAEISERTGVTVDSMDELNKAVDDGILVFDNATGKYIKAGEEVRNFDAEVADAAKGSFDFAGSVNKISDALGLNATAAGETVKSYATLADAEKAVLEANSDVTDQYIIYNDGAYELHQSQKKLSESSEDVAAKTKKLEEETGKLTERQKLAIQHTNELELKLLELASNERIKSMEFSANIKVAEMETDAQRVVAAFEEIGQAVAATQAASAEIFSSLTGALGDDKIRGLDKNFLREYALEQQKQAQQALDDQSRLIDAQVYWMNAKTEALNSGKPMITINADDLAPELQMVLKSLLEHIQIEANAEGLELLVG